MGWGRMLLLGNVGQQLDIGDVENTVNQMQSAVQENQKWISSRAQHHQLLPGEPGVEAVSGDAHPAAGCQRCGEAGKKWQLPSMPSSSEVEKGQTLKPMRSATNSVFGGVCSGLAELWGLSPRRMRVVWVIATVGTAFAGGIVYLLLWYLLPRRCRRCRLNPPSINRGVMPDLYAPV